mgnify:CR=1 FL=1
MISDIILKAYELIIAYMIFEFVAGVMERIVEQTLLYDFYGELLTPHQKMIYEEYVLDNFSISEIAKEHNISRQGVHDQLKRVDRLLNEYESTLHLIDRFMKIKDLSLIHI